jgi:hypothetical protein
MHIGAHKNEWGSEAVNIVGSHPVGVGVLLLSAAPLHIN